MSALKVSRASPVVESPAAAAARRAAAGALRSASAVLARLARRVAAPAAPKLSVDPRLEFYAEAGAPEGALYLDGQWVGQIEGVHRL